MPRPEGWPERLAAYLDRVAGEPSAWGARDGDCVLFAAGGIEAATGAHPCPEMVGAYADEAGARALVDAAGGLATLVTARLGPPLASPLLARRGDVVLFLWRLPDGTDEERLGLISPNGPIACRSPVGWGEVRLTRATLAWPVGR